MNDETTGSRMTFLYSKLRSRTDVRTMVEQIQVKQWYNMVDEVTGKLKAPKKTRPVVKFRQLAANKSITSSTLPNGGALSVALNDEAGDGLLGPQARVESNDLHAPVRPQRDHLSIVDVGAAVLLDILSPTPRDVRLDAPSGASAPAHENETVSASNVDWD
ncbi:hypothetical protein FRC12_019094 [Ceratobasidium sp. 428]|nr:hypothetical protein FRC12_019094 [Ceratobasidium sp. 428]